MADIEFTVEEVESYERAARAEQAREGTDARDSGLGYGGAPGVVMETLADEAPRIERLVRPGLTNAPDVLAPGGERLPSQVLPRASRALEVAGPVVGALSDFGAFANHAAAGHDAIERGDYDTMGDQAGECVLDLLSAAPGLGTFVSVARFGHDFISERWGDGRTLGQRLAGADGGQFADIEARDRIIRGDLAPHRAVRGHENHERIVQERIRELMEQDRRDAQATQDAYRQEFPNGSQLDVDPVAQARAAEESRRRAATYDQPAPAPHFTSISNLEGLNSHGGVGREIVLTPIH